MEEVLAAGRLCVADLFAWLGGEGAAGASGDPAALERAVGRSVEIKATFCMESCDRGPTVRVNGHVLRKATFEMVRDTLASAAVGTLPVLEARDECVHA